MRIKVTTPVPNTPRNIQLRGLFDIPLSDQTTEQWEPTFQTELEDKAWNIGLITGPSGSGKSTIANALWPDAQRPVNNYRQDESIIQAFPDEMSLRDITEALSSVGFSSPPAWLRPHHVLSTGQQFRCDIALLMAKAQPGQIILCDEYTSVIDRTVAQIGSAAIAKQIRRRSLSFIAVSCHDDIIDWLQPDWTYLPATNDFAWRSPRRPPEIELQITRCFSAAWPLFAPHHYLTQSLNPSATCWLMTHRGRPVAFTAWLPFVGQGRRARREHRTVCLPDFQGVGIGNALSSTIASMWAGLGYRATSTTTHPGMIQSRQRSPLWAMTRPPTLNTGKDPAMRHATTRLTSGFAYVGPIMQKNIAAALHS